MLFLFGTKKAIIYALVVFAVAFGAFVCADIGWRYLPFTYDELLLFFLVVYAAGALLISLLRRRARRRKEQQYQNGEDESYGRKHG